MPCTGHLDHQLLVIEAMLEKPVEQLSSESARWYVVFDRRDGRIVHSHCFLRLESSINQAEVDESAELHAQKAAALQAAQEFADPAHLQVMQVPAAMSMDPAAKYRVDLQSGELVQQKQHPASLREAVERARARKSANRQE
jgi:hypothetical protein